MKARLKLLKLRDLALFMVVSGVVAVSTVCGAQEIGLDGERAGARSETATEQQAQPLPNQEAAEEVLSLSLSVSEQICETGRARESYGVSIVVDEEGNRTERKRSYGWRGVASVFLSWTVSGGEAPYSLEIDNETAYKGAVYRGASGGTGVGCADTSGGTNFLFGERLYNVDPMVDSGWKTVRATVTDANGDTAEATARFYVILVDPVVLTRGETYRVFGHLITAPPNHDLRNLSIADRECDDAGLRCDEDQIGISLTTSEVDAQLFFFLSDGSEAGRWQVWRDGTIIEGRNQGASGAAGGDAIDQAFDALLDSFGDLPQDEGATP